MLLVGFFGGRPAAAQDSKTRDARSWVALLESRYRAAGTSEATFLERYTESGRVLRVEAGNAYFRHPGKMRWEYATPEKNLFLVDGKTAWFYVPGERSVSRVPAKQSGDWRTPLALLAGEMKLSRVCARVQLATSEKPLTPGNVVLDCALRGAEKSQPSSSQSAKAANGDRDGEITADTTVFLEVDRQSGDLVRVLVNDPGGVSLEFRFTNWQFNPVIAEGQFEFHPPQGVAILNGELPAQKENVK
jgi:outer membrane lipoprotein carrier protein